MIQFVQTIMLMAELMKNKHRKHLTHVKAGNAILDPLHLIKVGNDFVSIAMYCISRTNLLGLL